MALRLVQVGMGGWGRDWAKNVLPNVPEIEVVAHVDAAAETLETAREAVGFPAEIGFASLDAALAATEADAVLVTVPLAAHVAVALSALEAGKHVLVEKPFAPTVADAQRVVGAADAAGRTLMVSQNYRNFPAPRAVAALIASGELGSVGTVHVDFRRNYNKLRNNARYYQIANPLLLDMAIHHFDLMRLTLGAEAARIFCRAWNPPYSDFADNAAAAATIDFAGGAVVTWRGSWISSGPATVWGGEWRVECEGGEIVWQSRGDGGTPDSDRVTVRPMEGPERELDLAPTEPHGRAGVVTAFAAAIAGGTEPETSGRDNLATLGIAEAAIASVGTGAVVTLAPE
ncbi:MAG: Gfo/Idh/MocA family oxidoreductase [Chloroflexia bacterium]|nr:Gfo/Idh/MocA family oxidoreductase [Chloroflexia bacterium]